MKLCFKPRFCVRRTAIGSNFSATCKCSGRNAGSTENDVLFTWGESNREKGSIMNPNRRRISVNALSRRMLARKLCTFNRTAGLAVAAMILLLGFAAKSAYSAPLLPVPVSTSPSNGDLNPYGVLFVSGYLGGTLQPGDLLISNFNNSNNVMFLGTTIVDIRNGAQTSTPFYTSTTAAEGLGLALGQLGNFIIIGNVPTVGSPPNTTAGAGALTVLNSSGGVVNTLSDPTATFIDGPWGLAINQGPSIGSKARAQIFVSNVLNGTVWRLDVTVSGYGVTINDEVEVGSGYLFELTFPTVVNGPAGLAYDAKHDVLYVASELDNEVFAIADAGSLTSNQTTPGTVVYSDTTHLHGPTGLLILGNGDLLTANDDGVNVNPNFPSELVEFTPSATGGTFVTQFSVDPATGGAFGIALERKGGPLQTLLAYVDDNQTTASILSLFTGLSFYGPI
jgi:hypothetical protein